MSNFYDFTDEIANKILSVLSDRQNILRYCFLILLSVLWIVNYQNSQTDNNFVNLVD